MKKDAELGNAFLDLALVGVLVVTIGVVVDLLRGDGIGIPILVVTVVVYGAYLVAALRAGALRSDIYGRWQSAAVSRVRDRLFSLSFIAPRLRGFLISS
jgi:hypothetical protein